MTYTKTYNLFFGRFFQKRHQRKMQEDGWNIIHTEKQKKRSWVWTIIWLVLLFPVALFCTYTIEKVTYERP